MPVCPSCETEYQPAIVQCADCGEALVEQLPPPEPEAVGRPAREVPVASFGTEAEALIVAGRLEEKGIRVVVVPRGANLTAWGSSGQSYELRVAPSSLSRTRGLLARVHRQRRGRSGQ
jgi:hypothetical protein